MTESAGRGGRVFHAWAGAKFSCNGGKNEAACKVIFPVQRQGLGLTPLVLPSAWLVGMVGLISDEHRGFG